MPQAYLRFRGRSQSETTSPQPTSWKPRAGLFGAHSHSLKPASAPGGCQWYYCHLSGMLHFLFSLSSEVRHTDEHEGKLLTQSH